STWAQIESMKTAKKLLEQYREETGEVIAIQPIVLDKCTEQELNEAEEHDLYSFQNEFSKLEKSFQSVKEALESGDMVTESDVNKISNNADTFCNTFSEQRCRTKNGRDFSEATPEEMEYLDKLNLKFAELQNLTYFKITEIKNQLKKQIAEGDAFLKDYEVFPEVSFILNENDPLCDDDSDNIIAHCNWHHFEECLAEAGLDWNQKDPDKLDCNWNDFSHCKDSPFYQKHHCHLFHALLDHIFPSLSLDDVLRIGDINIDIKVEHQTFLELDLKT
ncbi:MAG: hypothetical protein KAJ75_03940, partial [Alphaproteobacteria bacterium]|nr:hypothetical protein [Alphaproteobacteria bacterium]